MQPIRCPMLKFLSKFKFGLLSRMISMAAVMMVVLLGVTISPLVNTTHAAIAAPLTIAPFTTATVWQPLAEITDRSSDLEHAANKAEEASESIYEGLDRTKRVVGKTEPRNEVIEKAREHASDKWQSLADKTRAAKNSDESLSSADKKALEQTLEAEKK
jgi:hypothetical protein